jgi:lipoic acid synthetase
MGHFCTRNCRFCAVSNGKPSPVDNKEPARVAEAAKNMGLTHVVITSVTRDDLPDGGAGHFAETIKEIRKIISNTSVEVLIPDFQGNWNALKTVLDAHPNVLNHNLETVPRLYSTVRPKASYCRSLELLRQVRYLDHSMPIKSGLMLGLGETSKEIEKTLRDLLNSGCNLLTLGQYIQPTKQHLPVDNYVSPKKFDDWKRIALEMGFLGVASGPLVRSSYHAKELYQGFMESKL